MLVAYAVPRKANMPTTVTSEFTANARLANRSSRSKGASARRSATMNSAKKNTASRNPPITQPFDQPLVDPWITANSSANSETAMVTWPGQSSDRPSGAEEFRAANPTAALTSASRPTRTNAQRQVAVGSPPQPTLVTSPPRTGDTKPPLDSPAAQMAMPRARVA